MPIGKYFLLDSRDKNIDINCIAGELFDLEKLSEVCAANGRYSFFFTSWPLNM